MTTPNPPTRPRRSEPVVTQADVDFANRFGWNHPHREALKVAAAKHRSTLPATELIDVEASLDSGRGKTWSPETATDEGGDGLASPADGELVERIENALVKAWLSGKDAAPGGFFRHMATAALSTRLSDQGEYRP